MSNSIRDIVHGLISCVMADEISKATGWDYYDILYGLHAAEVRRQALLEIHWTNRWIHT